ncbi:MAG TPA: hypothetical protein VMV10_24725 [Pirellulales bacterium]|nr:hypothetical protein [Pirellulales bacterium]
MDTKCGGVCWYPCPAWLDQAHRGSTRQCSPGYGSPADLADEQILARLLELNLQRAAAQPK